MTSLYLKDFREIEFFGFYQNHKFSRRRDPQKLSWNPRFNLAFLILSLAAAYFCSTGGSKSELPVILWHGRHSEFSSVASHVRLLETPWTAADQTSLSVTNFQSSLKLMSIKWVMPSNHLILCHPLLLLPSIFASIRVFSSESVFHIRWPNYWSFSFSISPSNEYSRLISFRMDWLDLLAVQGTLKSLLQHYSSKASVLQGSAFFMVQLSHPYMTNEKPIAMTIWTFVGKVMSLLFNMLSSLF